MAEQGRGMRARAAGIVGTHGKALAQLTVVSVLGILATAGLQIVASRGLGPESYGLLAAALALINIAAIGSAALRNSVAVGLARSLTSSEPRARTRLDSTLVEAIVLAGAATIALLLASPWLATSLQSSPGALALTAAAVAPYFLFARALGLLQGSGDTRSVVWWSTGAQLAQLALVVVALALGFGVVGILAVYLVTAIGATVGSSIQSRTLARSFSAKPFAPDAVVVLALTVAFAWITNIDVVLVRAGVAESVAGSYAAAAVLVKTTLVLPAMLSLYLLPRFVGSRGNASLTRLGVNLSVLLTVAGGLLIAGVLALGGELIVSLLFGAAYSGTAEILPWFALMWVPMAATQAILVRITAISSRLGLTVLLGAAAAQWVGSVLLLPDLHAMITLNGIVGLLAFVLLYTVHALHARASAHATMPPA